MHWAKVFFGLLLGSLFYFTGFAQQERPQEATSLLGKPLLRPALSETTKRDFEEKLAVAKKVWQKGPRSVEAWIWLGRRTAYLGRYGDAIGIYTEAIALFPEDARLYRHRGHRYITVRKLDKAVADFEKAAKMVGGEADIVEPDGLPNAQNIPTSTLQTNIWYHLGLAYFVSGDFAKAEASYRRCLALSKNDDMWCATAHWLYMTLRRQGKDSEAEKLLEPVSGVMKIIENEGYFHLLQAYKDPQKMAKLRQKEHDDGVQSATVAFGLAHWLQVEGKTAAAMAAYRHIIAGEAWAAFGYLAAEAELARAN